jgi:hypothetical protein
MVDTVRAQLDRWLARLELVYQRELVAEEGFPLGLIWCRVEDMTPLDLPDAPGVIAMSPESREALSIEPALSLRRRFTAAAAGKVPLIAFIATGDYASATKIAEQLYRQAALSRR